MFHIFSDISLWPTCVFSRSCSQRVREVWTLRETQRGITLLDIVQMSIKIFRLEEKKEKSQITKWNRKNDLWITCDITFEHSFVCKLVSQEYSLWNGLCRQSLSKSNMGNCKPGWEGYCGPGSAGRRLRMSLNGGQQGKQPQGTWALSSDQQPWGESLTDMLGFRFLLAGFHQLYAALNKPHFPLWREELLLHLALSTDHSGEVFSARIKPEAACIGLVLPCWPKL